MKLQNELANVISAFETVKQKIPAYIEQVKKEGNYKDLETRIARDLLYATKGTKWICALYDRYDCNDDHIDTLAKQALRQVYPAIL